MSDTVQPQVLPAPQVTNWYGYVTAPLYLRLRAEPNVNATVVAEVPTGAQVVVSGANGGWLQVAYGALSGWMAATWVSQQAPVNDDSTVDQRSGK